MRESGLALDTAYLVAGIVAIVFAAKWVTCWPPSLAAWNVFFCLALGCSG